MSLLSVDEARRRLLDNVSLLPEEEVPLGDAHGRVLARSIEAIRDQPPFPASAMDGYAVRGADTADAPTSLALVGQSKAGERFPGVLMQGQAVRIFTGAPVPDGADAILIQENANVDADRISFEMPVVPGAYIRPAGLDYKAGDRLIEAGGLLTPSVLALAASAGYTALPCRRKPTVALLATGDELVAPGQTPGPDQITSSNSIGISGIVRACGGEPIDLGIAPDDQSAIASHISRGERADILVTIGGASVGDHDLAHRALEARGTRFAFWRIAMRPGKPLMVGRLENTHVVGVPGNPVSALVCALLFLAPLIRTMLGLAPGPEIHDGSLGADIEANDAREDYVRARLETRADRVDVIPFSRQDSSMLRTLAASDALLIRAPHAPPGKAGDRCLFIRLP